MTATLSAGAGAPSSAEMLARAQAGDREACGQVVLANEGLVRHVLARMRRLGYLAHLDGTNIDEDLIAEGRAAIFRCVHSFDLSRGNRFSSYACGAIFRGLRRYIDTFCRGGRAIHAHLDPKALGGLLAVHDGGDDGADLYDWLVSQVGPTAAQLVWGHAIDGHSLTEAAGEVGLDVGTARALWFSTRRKLRGAVAGGG